MDSIHQQNLKNANLVYAPGAKRVHFVKPNKKTKTKKIVLIKTQS